MAYAIGLIATDGCLSCDGRHLVFVSKDEEQVENLKRCLGLSVKTGRHRSGRRGETRGYYRVQWGDVVLYEFLLSIGLTSNKSLTLGALDIPDEYLFDFLRGSFDGDGSFYSYFDSRWKSSFMFYLVFTSASEEHVSWLRAMLERSVGVRGHVTVTHGSSKERHSVHNLRFAKSEAMIVIRKIYERESAPQLTRKRLKISEALRIIGESLPATHEKLPK